MASNRPDAATGGALYWSIIRDLARTQHGEFTINDVYGATRRVSRPAVYNYVVALHIDGHVEIASTREWGGRREHRYRLLTDRATPPRLSTLHTARAARRQQLWTAIRSLRAFTIREAAVAASTETTPVSDAVAQAYFVALRRAGYIALIGRDGPVCRYRLAPKRDTGPLAPIERHRAQTLVDRNTGEEVNLNDRFGWAA